MKTARTTATTTPASTARASGGNPDVQAAVEWLRKHGTKRTRDGMARYGLPSDQAFGVSVGDLRTFAKQLGRNHDLAVGLWQTGWYEARMLATMVDEPDRVTPVQMDQWCDDFDSWGICDTACFLLFDRTPHAWKKVTQWAKRTDEFGRRAAFALLASLAGHDKAATDDQFAACLPLIERAATDERNFVKKGVSWALRGIGHRSARLHGEALALAQRLADSPDATARWVGKDTLRDLNRPLVTKKLAGRKAKAGRSA
jgi:3-methyladenine DNA glycosylase AlkD